MILKHIEKLINDVLVRDPDLQRDISTMAGKVMAIEFSGPDLSVYILPGTGKLELQTDYAGETDVRIKGTPLALLKMAQQKGKQPTTFTGDVVISGDLALGQHLQQMIARLELDWEELLSLKVGDVAAHQIGNGVRAFNRWAQDSQQNLEQTLAEYLRIEARLTPSRYEIESFMNAVEDLRSDVDRLEQRINRLAGR